MHMDITNVRMDDGREHTPEGYVKGESQPTKGLDGLND